MHVDVAESSVVADSGQPRLPRANPTVVYQQLPDGGVLFCPTKEFYYGLNVTGACIWENLAPTCQTVDELCAVVDRRFPGAERERIRVDVSDLIARLSEHGLVVAP